MFLPLTRSQTPVWEYLLEKQQQNKAIVTLILGNEVGASLPV